MAVIWANDDDRTPTTTTRRIMRAQDNRNMSDMETMYVARIEALKAALDAANTTIDALRNDVNYAERMLNQVLASNNRK